jgi:Pyridoxamine 5'-phosphate oxidase
MTSPAVVHAEHGPSITSDDVRRALAHQSFAVLAHIDLVGRPRSSGVVYGMADDRLWVATYRDSRKAHDLRTGDHVSVTVPVRRGGILALLLPIPPATISFTAAVTVHAPGSLSPSTLPADLVKLLPDEGWATSVVFELAPVGEFLTYGIGVSLADMRRRARSLAHVPA